MAGMATLPSFSIGTEFLTHVLICPRAEELRSHDAVLTGRQMAMTRNLFYSSENAALNCSMCETKPTEALLSSVIRSNRRFAW